MSVDWTQGFRIESDGTAEGTKIYDSENHEIIGVQQLLLQLPTQQQATPFAVLTLGAPEIKPEE
jgi:hypothetical protein